jgi:integrase
MKNRRTKMGVYKKNGNWHIDYYDGNGRRHRKKIGPQKTLAHKALKDAQVRVAKGEYLGIYEERRSLFRDFATKTYIPYAKTNLSPRTFERTCGIIENHLIQYFDCYLCKISRKNIEDYKQKRASEVKPATVNKEYSTLRHMLKCAVDWGYITHNPATGVKELKEPPGRIRYLTPDEFQRLLSAAGPEFFADNTYNAGRTPSSLLAIYLRPIVTLGAHTGLRRGELLSLRWSHVDFKEQRIIIEQTKNNERKIAYLSDAALEALRCIPRNLHADLLFPGITPSQLSRAFERACKRASIEDFRFHDLRHTFASCLVMGGENIRTVQTLLGHKDLRMTMRYTHLSPEHLQTAAKRLDQLMPPNDIETKNTGGGQSRADF